MVCRTFNREQKKLNFHIFSSNKGHNYNRDREREWCQCGEGGVLKRKCLTEIIGAAMMMTSPVKIMKYPYCNIFVLSSILSSCSYNALLALYAFNRWNCNFYHLFSSALREKKNALFQSQHFFLSRCRFSRLRRLFVLSTCKRTHNTSTRIRISSHRNWLNMFLLVGLRRHKHWIISKLFHIASKI